MKIAVNTRLLIPNKLDGIGWFTHEVLSRIVKDHPKHEFQFIFDRKFDERYVYSSNVTPYITGPQARHPMLWYMWFDWSLPRLLNKLNPDVFLSTDGYLPLKSPVKKVNVIHDINFEHFPEILPSLTSKYYRKYFPKFAKDAERLVTVSEFSKEDIAKTYAVDKTKIDVVYNGVNEMFKEIGEEEKDVIKKKYTSSDPYIIFIGTIQERKNLVRMFKAFDLFKERTESKHKLVIAGRRMWWSGEMESTLRKMKFREDVILTGRVESTEELAHMTAAADMMLYVPVFEGFGVPVLEGQKAGIPVVTSNNSCLPEVTGEGGHFCDPFSEESIANALSEVVMNEELKQKLIAEGRKNAMKYSWDRTAELLWNSIEKVLHE